MICFKCNSEEFDIRESSVRQEFRGEKLDVKTHVSVCKCCGWQTLGSGQADELRQQTVDKYRRNHCLLTSSEIIARRTALGMSQQAFADFIEVGVASVKRWERGFVQEPVYDKLIRQKCSAKAFPCSLAWPAQTFVIVQSDFSVTNLVLTEAPTKYMVQPIGILSKVSKFTSRMVSDDQLAETSKNWRKKHSSACDTEFMSCL